MYLAGGVLQPFGEQRALSADKASQTYILPTRMKSFEAA